MSEKWVMEDERGDYRQMSEDSGSGWVREREQMSGDSGNWWVMPIGTMRYMSGDTECVSSSVRSG